MKSSSNRFDSSDSLGISEIPNVVIDSIYRRVPQEICENSAEIEKCNNCAYRISSVRWETSDVVSKMLGLTKEQYLLGTVLDFTPNCDKECFYRTSGEPFSYSVFKKKQ